MPDLLEMQRNLTIWYIQNGPPTLIVLTPRVRNKTPGKGITLLPGTQRPEQYFKMIWPGGDGLQTGNPDGTVHKFDMILLGLYDCEAEIGDVWSDGDQQYVIHSEFPRNGYERKFGVFSLGNEPSSV